MPESEAAPRLEPAGTVVRARRAWPRPRQVCRRGACAALLVIGAGCAPQEDQVVARVNGTPIVARELELALARAGSAADGGADNLRAARQHLLQSLIVEELLAQQYRRTTPGSAQVDKSALNAARRDLLARHFVASLSARIEPPDCEEIRSYYRSNPHLFGERRVFQLRQIEVPVPASREQELRSRVAAAASMDELAAWLRTADLRFVMSEAERGADELPPELHTRLTAMQPGQVLVLPAGQGVQIVQLRGSRTAPLDEGSAWPLIERRLWLERQSAALEAEIRKLSKMAAISFSGEETTLKMPLVATDIKGSPAPSKPFASCAARRGDEARARPDGPLEGELK